MLNTAKLMIYEIVLLLAKIRFRKQSRANNKILLVKTDEIGDYILFRNYIDIIKASYPVNQELIFVGNELWRNIFEHFDQQEPGITTIWINKKHFKRKMFYRYTLLKKINRLNASIAINLVYSSTRRFEDAIISASVAKTKIGYSGNEENALPIEKIFNKYLYTQLINVPYRLHDFLKHRMFLLQLLDTSFQNPTLDIPIVSNPRLKIPTGAYALIFPGSGNSKRIWDAANFSKVADFISETLNYEICLCGSTNDISYAEKFLANFENNVIDYCGKTNMLEVIELIQKSQFTVSIDTGSVHISAACGIPAFAVFNGDRYGRFAPYPAELKKNIYPIYPDEVEKQLLRNGTDDVVPGDYNDVTAEQVILSIQKHLSNQANG